MGWYEFSLRQSMHRKEWRCLPLISKNMLLERKMYEEIRSLYLRNTALWLQMLTVEKELVWIVSKAYSQTGNHKRLIIQHLILLHQCIQ